ncbi:uncharacterized protein [Clytia hemisphaerica]|uniref:uncharacterized protein n=1 Tax=Clytia hemisphaerica TaxID=252671 RepID=UPI0034D4F217
MMKILLLLFVTPYLAFGQRTIRCPFGLSTFSADSVNTYFQCQSNGVATLQSCPKNQFYWAKFGRCMELERQERNSTDVKYLNDVPVFGRNVQVGDLYNAHADRIVSGENLFTQETIDRERHRTTRTGSSANLFSARTTSDRLDGMRMSKRMSVSFLSGLLKTSGSGRFLYSANPTEDERTITFEHQITTHALSMKNNIQPEGGVCDQDTEATHTVSSVTYGLDCWMTFRRMVKKNESRVGVDNRLRHFASKMAFYATMVDSQYTEEEREFLQDMNVEVYVDFATDSLGSLTYQQATRIYKRLPTLLGNAPDYKSSKPVMMDIVPLSSFCDNGKHQKPKVVKEMGQSVQRTLMNFMQNLENFQSKAASMSIKDSILAFDDSNILRWFQIALSDKLKQLERYMNEIVPRVRSGDQSEREIINLMGDDWMYPFTLEKCKQFLNEREKEVEVMENILDIFKYDHQQNTYDVTQQQQNDESAKQQQQQNVDIKATWRALESYVKNDKLVAFNINVMSDVMDIERFLQPGRMEEKWWLSNETILYNMAQRARQFKQFTDQNSAPQKSGYLVRFVRYRDDEPFSVFSFSGPQGQSKSEIFNIPIRPEQPVEKEVGVDHITLGINKVPYGNSFYQSLVVFWKRQGSENYEQANKYDIKDIHRNLEQIIIRYCILIFILGNLNPSTDYEFQFAYDTEFGQSRLSEMSDVIRTKVATKPRNLRVVNNTNEEISLAWDEPSMMADNRSVVYYTVSMFRDNKTIRHLTVENREARFNRMTFMKMGEYKFQVVAMVTKMETSLPSEMLMVQKCPNPPREIFLQEREYSFVALNWDHKNSDQMNNTNEDNQLEYIVYYAPRNENNNNGSIDSWKTIRTQFSGILLNDLKEDEKYIVKIKVSTNDCTSEFSRPLYFSTRQSNQTESLMEQQMSNFTQKFTDEAERVHQSVQQMNQFMNEQIKNQTEMMMNQTEILIQNLQFKVMKAIEDTTERSTGCKWTMGDGISRVELALNGEFENKWDCYRACIKKSGHTRHQTINGATYGVKSGLNGKCFCEKEMRAIDGMDSRYLTCRFAPVYNFDDNNKDDNQKKNNVQMNN